MKTREEQLADSELVKLYVDARIRSDRAETVAKETAAAAGAALINMQEAWRRCKHAEPGVYSFKDHGRTCVVVDPLRDYPRLLTVVQ